MASDRRVVITGAGPVSAIGVGMEEYAAALQEGEGGIAEVSAFETDGYESRLAAEIREFDVSEFLESEKAYLDRASGLALAAANLALADASLDADRLAGENTGILLGSAFGSLGTMSLFFRDFLEKGPRLVKPFLFPHTYSNTAISLLAIEYNLRGVHLNFASGWVSSSCAILEAFDLVRLGRTDMVLAGGCEALSEPVYAGYGLTGLLSPLDGDTTEQGAARLEEVCAPFDRRRNGFVLGEGACVLVVEEMGHAMARKARILGEILGAGICGDRAVCADGRGGGTGIAEAMRKAAGAAVSGGARIDFISASANGGRALDRHEAGAIALFTREAGCGIPVSSIKSMVGETAGAGGALQMAAALASMESGFIPPTVNLESVEDGFDVDVVAGVRRVGSKNVLLNSVDPGGGIVSFLVAKVEDAGDHHET